MPNALVTGSPELVPDIVIALKSAGFDILAVRDSGPAGVSTILVGDDRSPDEIALLASVRPLEPLPWWRYADVDGDLGFADWRDSVLCLASQPSP